MIIVYSSITIIYVLFIGSFIYGFTRTGMFELTELKPKTRFSIVVPFRNEACNLPALLESITRLSYPLDHFEIIFINDASEDNSVEILNTFLLSLGTTPINIKLLDNIRTSNSPKKDAITLAITQAKYDWIITTDADTILPKYWLNSYDELIQKEQPNFIAGPVTYLQNQGFLQNFQLLDILSLQGATIGGFGLKKPFLCNGANLGYKKQLFITVNGFEGNDTMASGDDIFLLEKALQINRDKVHYLKCPQAIVYSVAQNTTSELVAQRVRWAGKTSAYRDWFGKFTAGIILIQNALLLGGLFFGAMGWLPFKALIYMVIIKFGIDFLLIYTSAEFFTQKNSLKYYVPSAVGYPFFSVYVVFRSLFKGYSWKGRHYNK